MPLKINKIITKKKSQFFFACLIVGILPLVASTQNDTSTALIKNHLPQKIDNDPIEKFKTAALGSKYARMPAEELYQEYCKITAPEHRQEISKVLLLHKDIVLPTVMDRLHIGSEKEKVRAIKLVSQNVWQETSPVLMELLSNTAESETVRIGAIYAIGELNIRTTVPFLLDQLNKASSEQMQRAILLTLGKLKDPNSANTIELYRTNKDSLVRLYAEVALAKIGKLLDKPSTAIDLSNSDDWKIRSEAIRALGEIGGSASIQKLIEISATHTLPGVRQAAKQSIEKAKFVGMGQDRAIEYIQLKVNDADREIQSWAINVAAKELGNKGLGILKEKAKEPGEVGEAAAFAYIAQDEARKATEPEELGGSKK